MISDGGMTKDDCDVSEMDRAHQLSVSETKTPWSFVSPFVGFVDGSIMSLWRSAILAVCVAAVKTCIAAFVIALVIVEDEGKGDGRENEKSPGIYEPVEMDSTSLTGSGL